LLLLRSFWPEHAARVVAHLPAPVAAASSLPPATASVARLPPLEMPPAPAASTIATAAGTASAAVADSAQPAAAGSSEVNVADAPSRPDLARSPHCSANTNPWDA
jgi:hypothetical protein